MSRLMIVSGFPGAGNEFLYSLLEQIKDQLAASRQEIAHLKAYLVTGQDWAKASCVSLAQPIEFDQLMGSGFTAATLVLNTLAAVDPDRLCRICEEAIRALAVPLRIRVD